MHVTRRYNSRHNICGLRGSCRLHSRDSRKIRMSGIPVHVIHGQYDPLAMPFFARRVQRRLRCTLTMTGAPETGSCMGLCTFCCPEASVMNLEDVHGDETATMLPRRIHKLLGQCYLCKQQSWMTGDRCWCRLCQTRCPKNRLTHGGPCVQRLRPVCRVQTFRWSAAEASHAGITVESCTVLLPALEVAMFGHTLGDAELWKRRQEQATANVVCNPFFLSL